MVQNVTNGVPTKDSQVIYINIIPNGLQACLVFIAFNFSQQFKLKIKQFNTFIMEKRFYTRKKIILSKQNVKNFNLRMLFSCLKSMRSLISFSIS